MIGFFLYQRRIIRLEELLPFSIKLVGLNRPTRETWLRGLIRLLHRYDSQYEDICNTSYRFIFESRDV